MMKSLAISVLVLAALASSANAAVVISKKATKHMSCASGVCTPTAKNAVLNVGDLQTMLAASDVSVNTGAGAVSISINAPLTWTSASRLTLAASNGIAIKAAVVVEGTGAVTLTPSGGALNFFPGGAISFWDNTSSLIISGQAYTLVSDIATLAGDIAVNRSGFYALAKDYDATGDGTYTDAVVTGTFPGTFDGLGHAIANLSISADDHSGNDIGLFAEIDGAVSALSLTNADVDCGDFGANTGVLAGENKGTVSFISVTGGAFCFPYSEVGGVVGGNDGGTISHAAVNINVYGGFDGGGIAGESTGMIESATVAGSVNGGYNSRVGGVVGVTTGSVLDAHVSATLDVLQGDSVGGVVGYSGIGTIKRCSSSGAVTAKSTAAGIVGFASGGSIDSSFATGNVQAARNAGGIIGQSKGFLLTNSYATGSATVTGTKGNRAGGLIGLDTGVIRDSWSSGAVVGGSANHIGGVAGVVSSATSTAVYWDLDTSGISDPSKGAGNKPNAPGLTGLTTAQFQSGLPTGFDPSVWAQSPSINNGYPYLIANPPQ
jgi:hypothetical protein